MMTVIETFVINASGCATGMIYDKYTGGSVCMLDSDDVSVNVIKELGENVTVKDLQEGDILSLIRFLDGFHVAAVFTNTEVIGKITNIIDDEGGSSITIDDDVFPVLTSFLEYEHPEIGEVSAFRLNDNGAVWVYQSYACIGEIHSIAKPGVIRFSYGPCDAPTSRLELMSVTPSRVHILVCDPVDVDTPVCVGTIRDLIPIRERVVIHGSLDTDSHRSMVQLLFM